MPPHGVETAVARGLLPDVVPHADAAANAGRAALLVAALTRQPELLLARHRGPAAPGRTASRRCRPRSSWCGALRADGLPAVVSGAGPTVLVLTDGRQQPTVARRAPDGWRALVVPLDRSGARVDLPEEAPRGSPGRPERSVSRDCGG